MEGGDLVLALEHVPVGLCDLPDEERVVGDVGNVDGMGGRVTRPEIVGSAGHGSLVVGVQALGRMTHAVDAVHVGAEVVDDGSFHGLNKSTGGRCASSQSSSEHGKSCLPVHLHSIDSARLEVGVERVVEVVDFVHVRQAHTIEDERVPGKSGFDMQDPGHWPWRPDVRIHPRHRGLADMHARPVSHERMPAVDDLDPVLLLEPIDEGLETAVLQGGHESLSRLRRPQPLHPVVLGLQLPVEERGLEHGGGEHAPDLEVHRTKFRLVNERVVVGLAEVVEDANGPGEDVLEDRGEDALTLRLRNNLQLFRSLEVIHYLMRMVLLFNESRVLPSVVDDQSTGGSPSCGKSLYSLQDARAVD
mmetsp:Transcript_18643/g.42600  ORF Transcript_18643/g.42600 Transcript_18643/m.42600 type:complete len:360 (-) Transcript_18643:1021-2100(-)